MQTYTLSDDLMAECAALVYRQWAQAHDNLKAVRAEKPTQAEPDWAQFHQARLTNAQTDLAKWTKLKEEIAPLIAHIYAGVL